MGFFGAGALPIRAWVSSAVFAKEAVVSYLLRATWDSAGDQGYADAQVLDTVGEGVEDGSFTVKNTGATIECVSNELKTTGGADNYWGDLGIVSQSITRTFGYTLFGTLNVNGFAIAGLSWGDSSTLSENLNVDEYAVELYPAGPKTAIRTDTGWGDNTIIDVAIVADTDFQYALVLGGYDSNAVPWRTGETAADYKYGCAVYIKGGTYTNWTLLWRVQLGNDTPLYVQHQNWERTGRYLFVDDIKVPDQSLEAVLQPTALSTFTDSNGTSLDAITPEVGGTWTEEQGNWDIQSNYANVSTHDGSGSSYSKGHISTTLSDFMIDCIVRGTTGRIGSIGFRFTDDTHWWMCTFGNPAGNQVVLYEQNNGWTSRASTAVTVNLNTDYDLRVIADGQNIDCFVDGGYKITYGSAALNETETTHGIAGNSTNCRAKNFAVYPRTSATYTTEFDAV